MPRNPHSILNNGILIVCMSQERPRSPGFSRVSVRLFTAGEKEWRPQGTPSMGETNHQPDMALCFFATVALHASSRHPERTVLRDAKSTAILLNTCRGATGRCPGFPLVQRLLYCCRDSRGARETRIIRHNNGCMHISHTERVSQAWFNRGTDRLC